MRRHLVLVACLLAGPAAGQTTPPPATNRAPPREVSVVNNTDRTLRELYIAPPNAEQGADRLGSAVLPARATLRVPFAAAGAPRPACVQEVRGVLEDGEEIRRRQDLCRSPRILFAETGPSRDVQVSNDSDRTLRELYVWPAGTPGPGPDRLGSGTLRPNETQGVRLRGFAGCRAELRGVFADDTEETRAAFDLCRAPRIGFGDPTIPRRRIEVGNGSRRTIRELYARPADGDGWGADRLETDVLPAGQSRTVMLRGTACAWDLRAVFMDGQENVRRGHDVCAQNEYEFGPGAAGPAHRITLINGYGRTIQQVFVSAAGAAEWTRDALGSDILPPAGRQPIELELGCKVDLRIVFANGAAEERPETDLCAAETLLLRPGWTAADRVGSAGPTTRPQPGRTLLRNAGALPIVELYADPPGGARGVDRLGTAVIGRGASHDFEPPGTLERRGTACAADLTAVFRDGREWRSPGVDLCAGREVVVQ